MAKIKVDPKRGEELIAELEAPKPRKYIQLLWEPIVKEAKEKFGDSIVKVEEVFGRGSGSRDAYYDIIVKRDGERIHEFFRDKRLDLLVDHGVDILAWVKEEK